MIPPLDYTGFFLSLAAVAIRPVAGSSNSSCSSTTTITSQSDADALSSCSTLSGTLTISPSATGTISIPNIQTLNGGLVLQDTSSLDTLSASDLQTVHGKIYIEDNDALRNLSLPDLQTVGGEIDISGNAKLKDLVLDGLQEVDGALVLSGTFDEISFSDLDSVKGQTSIKSHGGSFRCSSLDSLRGDDDDDDNNNHNHNHGNSNSNSNSVFQGSYSCSDGSSSGLSAGAKAGIAIAVIVVVMLIVLFAWWRVRKMRKQKRRRNGPTDKNQYTAVGVGHHDEEMVLGDEKTRMNRNSDLASPGNIPRKPLSPPPPEEANTSMDTSMLSTSPPVPVALLPGAADRATDADADGQSLFLHPIPRRRPSETDVPLLDSGDVHEAPAAPVERVYELDGGPVRGTHQQPINHE
ncbi:hypothetical protein BO70DRAFT_366142 [Aspergillus heteromorphus CBS 117.55]|uniref:Receptor L-domain domain-containing protein n=1 Tax=Aspergillus heteromorphus CBS 117.55 TaxID=1448321 RepID=A0A317V312_9EURO|nr:uncharacterized protein BO70DRAFT_366142 [Aspergillus heteromorphus CBS 117.55]PWY68475.1 hypothetical protein BO70DRAFT_366142 [Aspergillus heteromorphus CBS 117.55]